MSLTTKYKGYRAILFDFDYTLGDATEAIFAGFTFGMTQLGNPPPEREAIRHTVGMLLEDAYSQLSGDETEVGRETFRTLFSQVARPMQQKGVPLCAGAKDLLLALHDRGLVTAVVSTKHTPTLESILEYHELLTVFTAVIGGDLVAVPKPNPEGIFLAMSRLGVSAHDVLYCGDTVIDAEAAQRAGVDFCAVLNGTTPAEAFAKYPYKQISPNLIQLQQWLDL